MSIEIIRALGLVIAAAVPSWFALRASQHAKEAKAETKPNGGSSFRDQVMHKLGTIEGRLSVLERRGEDDASRRTQMVTRPLEGD